jgi:hypothetical protein
MPWGRHAEGRMEEGQWQVIDSRTGPPRARRSRSDELQPVTRWMLQLVSPFMMPLKRRFLGLGGVWAQGAKELQQ